MLLSRGPTASDSSKSLSTEDRPDHGGATELGVGIRGGARKVRIETVASSSDRTRKAAREQQHCCVYNNEMHLLGQLSNPSQELLRLVDVLD